MSIGTTAIRGAVGPLFIGHGAQKLWGAFGGHGLEGTGGFFESLGLRPGRRHALAAGVAETAGGTLLTLGALTPVATAALTATMVTAIRKVHGAKGPWNAEGGWEYNAVLVALLTALAESGPGALSVDERAFPRLHGRGWAAVSLAAGVAGSYLATSEAVNGAAAPQVGSDGGFAASGGVDARETIADAQAQAVVEPVPPVH